MIIILKNLTTFIVLFLLCHAANANSCLDISNEFEGKWLYTISKVQHVIEFQANEEGLLHDGVQKKMWLCTSLSSLNVHSFQLKGEHTSYRLTKKNDKTEEGENLISVNFKKYDLLPYVEKEEEIPSAENNFKWKTYVEMDGHIFPSLLISTATWSDEAKELLAKKHQLKKVEVLGDPLGLFVVGINNANTDTKIKIEVSIDDIANPSFFEETFKDKKLYVIKPRIDYNYQKLLAIKQPMPMNAKIVLYVNGEKFGEQFITVTVRSINDAPIATISEDKRAVGDLSFVFAGFVNENNPRIDGLLREALNTGEINRFVGYQAGQQEVFMQVYSIWNALQRRGVRYSSITTPTAESSKVFSQYVRFVNDTLETSQANCIDGTVLFASILRRIGINTKIVLVPGHAFLGFDLDPNGRQTAFLETTMIGNTDLGSNANVKNFDDKLSKMLGVKSMKNQISYKSFVNAINEGQRKAAFSWPQLTSNNLNYKIIDVKLARETGIMPINY